MVPKRFWGLFFELTVFARLLQRKVNIFNEWRVFAPHFNLSFQHPSFPSCVWLRIQCSPFPLVFFGGQKIPAGSQTWLAGKFPMKFDDREILAVSPFHPLFSRQHLSNISFQKPQYSIKVPLFNYYIMHIPSYSMDIPSRFHSYPHGFIQAIGVWPGTFCRLLQCRPRGVGAPGISEPEMDLAVSSWSPV